MTSSYYDSVLKAPRSVLTVSNRECERSKQVKAEMTDEARTAENLSEPEQNFLIQGQTMHCTGVTC